MSMLTGTLSDCGFGHLAGLSPQLVFTLSGPAVSASDLYVTAPIAVTPAANGAWSVQLAPTDTMRQLRYYSLRIQWLDAAGNFIKVDFPDWKIPVPTSGGALPDLVDNFLPNPLIVIYQAVQPDPWPIGSVWVDTSIDTPTSGDLKRRKA